MAGPSAQLLLTTTPQSSSPALGISPELRAELCCPAAQCLRSGYAEQGLSPLRGHPILLPHVGTEPPAPCSWAGFSHRGGNRCLHGARKRYPSYMKFLALPVGWPGPHVTTP